MKEVKEWKQTVTATDVRFFIGFCNFSRKFIKNFTEIAQQLHALTKKNMRFCWNKKYTKAFERLQEELIDAPVLAFPDYDCPFILKTDASCLSLEALLSNDR